LAKAGSASSTAYVGCSDPVIGDQGAADVERFLLLSSFPRAAPVAGIAVNSEEVVVAASWDGRAQLFDFGRWCECGELDPGVEDAGLGPHRGTCGSTSSPAGCAKKSAVVPRGHRNKIGGGDDSVLVDVACLPCDPQFFGVAAGREVQLWRHVDRKLSRQAALRHSAVVGRLHFHEVAGMVGSVSDDGVATLWDTAECCALRKMDCATRPTSLRFAGGGGQYQFSMVIGGLDGLIQIWDIRRASQPQHSLAEPSASICVDCHASSHLLAAGNLGGELHVWDMRTWRVLKTVNLRAHLGSRAAPRSIAVSPCGSFLATGCVDGELVVFDIQRQYQAFKVLHHGDAVNALAWGGPVTWATAQHFLAAASLDGTWSCWTHGGRACHVEH